MANLAQMRSEAMSALVRLALAEARAGYERLRAELVARFGEGHVYVAGVDETLAGVCRAAGDLAAARRCFERARAVAHAVDTGRAASIDKMLATLEPLSDEQLARRPRLRLSWERGDDIVCRSAGGTWLGAEQIDRHAIRDGDVYTIGAVPVAFRLSTP